MSNHAKKIRRQNIVIFCLIIGIILASLLLVYSLFFSEQYPTFSDIVNLVLNSISGDRPHVR